MKTFEKINQLTKQLNALQKVTIAVSGGIDSLVLSYIAHQTLGHNAQMAHANSSAVPSADAERVMNYATKYGWNLKLVDTGEMKNEAYRKNPVNRCYYCKTGLYNTLNNLNFGPVLSGTNLDDLSDYRPGLVAAKENSVIHPYVDNHIDKNMIRAIARHFNLDDVSDIPASPCLSSRIETGVYILPNHLLLINDVEKMLRTKINAENIRCRLLSDQMMIEIDQDVLTSLSSNDKQVLINCAQSIASAHKAQLPIHISHYKRGSAFLGAA